MYFYESEMPGKRTSKKSVESPTRQIVPIPDAAAPPVIEDEDSIDEEIMRETEGYPVMTVRTPDRLSTLFYDDDEYKDVYEPYTYKGKYVLQDVNDTKWRHAKAKEKVTMDMGINELAQVVGTKRARDIRRRGHFMSPQAFAAWQVKHDPKGRYSYDDTRDLDGDHDPEFIVEHTDRYGNKKLVAVNGWTTTKSDYPLRKEYYDTYPTAGERKANKWKPWLRTKSGIDESLDEYGFPTHKYIEDRAIKNATSRYEWHMPLFNARSEFMKNVVWAAYRDARDAFVDNGFDGAEIQNACNNEYKHGWVVKTGGEFWNAWILDPFMEVLRKSEYYKDNMRDYASKFKRNVNGKLVSVPFDASDREHVEMFEKSLMKKDKVRMSLNAEVRNCLNDEEGLRDALAYIANIFTSYIGKALKSDAGKDSPPRKAVMAKYHH